MGEAFESTRTSTWLSGYPHRKNQAKRCLFLGMGMGMDVAVFCSLSVRFPFTFCALSAWNPVVK
jgi:hypothetical protein